MNEFFFLILTNPDISTRRTGYEHSLNCPKFSKTKLIINCNIGWPASQLSYYPEKSSFNKALVSGKNRKASQGRNGNVQPPAQLCEFIFVPPLHIQYSVTLTKVQSLQKKKNFHILCKLSLQCLTNRRKTEKAPVKIPFN